MKKYIIPITNPYSQEKENNENTLSKEDLTRVIEEHLKKTEENKEIEYIVSIRPNYINKETLKILKKYKIKTIELEVKSTNDYILNKLEMSYTLKDIKKASKLIKLYRFKLGYQIMIGLPESTKIDDINTTKTLIKLKPKMVSVTPLLVIKGSELEKEYNEQKYKPLTLVQAVETCKELVGMLNDKKIETIAIGYGILDNDLEQLEIAEKVVDGPFHPSFRQLVESGLWYDAIVNKIKQLNVKVMQVEVIVNPIDVNNVIGFKQENIDKLKELYDVELIVTADENIKQGKSKIDITKTYQDFKNS
jgi:hypothetical protein